MENVELVCVAVGLILVAPELSKVVQAAVSRPDDYDPRNDDLTYAGEFPILNKDEQ